MKINVSEYGISPVDSLDLTRKLRELLDKYRGQREICLYFPAGDYHFYPDYAEEILLYIPNHDEDGLKRVAFNLTGYSGLQICGEEAHFIFHADILPFLVRQCRDIRVEGISIDYARPGYSQGIIRRVAEKTMEIEIDPKEFPWHVRGDRVYFYGENYCHELERWMEIDQETEGPVYGLTDRTFNLNDAGEEAHFEQLETNLLKVCLGKKEKGFEKASRPGNYLILRHHPRNCPAIFVEGSSQIQLVNIQIYHALAMGVIACRSENLLLEKVEICRHPDKRHIFTTEADGLHFVLCRGFIKIRKCLCENQLDDAVNIHGIYGRVGEVFEDGSFLVELVHHQQKGVTLIEAGESFQIVRHDTMLPFIKRTARRAERWNKDYFRVWPDEPIPQIEAGQALENLNWMPEVEIDDCTFRNNRARGILCTTGKQALIRNNYFHVPGAALLMEGDASGWFESGASGGVVLENNVFDCCAYVPEWGKAPVQLTPSAKVYEEQKAYHARLEVRNNDFYVTDERLVYGENLGELVWEGNRLQHTDRLPGQSGEAFALKHILKKNIDISY